MWNIPTKERLAKIPRLYETENIPARDKLIHLHCFIAGCDWYIAEYDGNDLFWGYAILNKDYEMAEWGYISFSELKSIKLKGWLEVDCEIEAAFPVKRAVEVENIRIGNGWIKENNHLLGIGPFSIRKTAHDQAKKGGMERDEVQRTIHQK